MNKLISSEALTPTLELTECTEGFWLYDTTRGMNLSMRAKSGAAALVEAIEYYQERLLEVEQEYTSLSKKVNAFVAQIVTEELS